MNNELFIIGYECLFVTERHISCVNWADGNTWYGNEHLLTQGFKTRELCADKCIKLKHENDKINSATYNKMEKRCTCKWDASGWDEEPIEPWYETCYFSGK